MAQLHNINNAHLFSLIFEMNLYCEITNAADEPDVGFRKEGTLNCTTATARKYYGLWKAVKT